MNFKKIKTTIILVGIFLAIFVFASKLVQTAAAAATPVLANQYKYQTLEAFPGFFAAKASPDFPDLILALYKFGIWTVGIAGLFMLTIGGVMYMASAGNNATATSAKGIITDSLLGILAALCAYLVMYVINPDLTKIDISFTAAKVEVKNGVNSVYKTIAGNPSSTNVSFAASCTADSTLSAMKSASSGVCDPCLAFALLSTESQCNPSAKSPAGACGISQIMPSTAGKDCDWLINNPEEAIKMGVNQLMSVDRSKLRGDLSGTDGKSINQALMDLYAAYNGGAGALGKSNSCSPQQLNDYGNPFVKWDCPIDPGGYTETVKATTKFVSYYMKCKGDSLIQGKLH